MCHGSFCDYQINIIAQQHHDQEKDDNCHAPHSSQKLSPRFLLNKRVDNKFYDKKFTDFWQIRAGIIQELEEHHYKLYVIEVIFKRHQIKRKCEMIVDDLGEIIDV